jgi:O-antigen/teichoic acid export membrane protein
LHYQKSDRRVLPWKKADVVTDLQNVTLLAKGTGLGVLGLLLRTILTFVYTMIATRLIGPEQYGIYAVSLSIILIGSLIAEFGMNMTTVNFVVIAQNTHGAGGARRVLFYNLKLSLILSLLVTAALLVLAVPLSNSIYGIPNLKQVLWLHAASIPFVAAGGIFVAFTVAQKTMLYKFMIRDLLQPLVELIFSTILIILGLKAGGLALGYTLSGLVFSLAGLLIVNRLAPADQEVGSHRDITRPDLRPILGFSLPLFFSQLLGLLNLRLSILLVGALASIEYAGVLNVASDIARFGAFFLLALGNIYNPFISDLIQRGEKSELGYLYNLTTRWLVSFSFPLFIWIILNARDVISLFGPSYAIGATALILLMLAQFVNVGVGGTDSLIVMSGRTKLDMLNNVLGLLIVLLASIWFIPRYGLIGAALAQSCFVVSVNVIKLLEVRLLVGIQPYTKALLKPALGALLATGCGYLASVAFFEFNPLIKLALVGLSIAGSYFISLYILGPEPEDIMVIRTLARGMLKSKLVV